MYFSYIFNEDKKIQGIEIRPLIADIESMRTFINTKANQLYNPARMFADKMNKGYLDDLDKDLLTTSAIAANLLSDAWKEDPFSQESGAIYSNMLKVLSRLACMYVRKCQAYSDLLDEFNSLIPELR